jgi:hypothetical protein
MVFPTLAARLASASLLGTLAFGISGIGTAAAASSHHASLNIASNPASAVQVGAGSRFTDTFVISDPDSNGTQDVTLQMMFDPAVVQLQGVQFNRAGAWVDATMPNGFDAQLGDIGSHGDSVTVMASFKALAGYPAGAPLQAQLEASWRDDNGNHHDMSSVPMLASGPGQATTAASAGMVTVAAGGFMPGEAVTFWYNLPDGTAAPLYLRNGQLTTAKTHQARVSGTSQKSVDNATVLYADANGRISISFADAGLALGSYSIVAHGATDGVNAVIPFSV